MRSGMSGGSTCRHGTNRHGFPSCHFRSASVSIHPSTPSEPLSCSHTASWCRYPSLHLFLTAGCIVCGNGEDIERTVASPGLGGGANAGTGCVSGAVPGSGGTDDCFRVDMLTRQHSRKFSGGRSAWMGSWAWSGHGFLSKVRSVGHLSYRLYWEKGRRKLSEPC